MMKFQAWNINNFPEINVSSTQNTVLAFHWRDTAEVGNL
jgi:hypothetical protein